MTEDEYEALRRQALSLDTWRLVELWTALDVELMERRGHFDTDEEPRGAQLDKHCC